MTPERHEQICHLFREAIGRDASQRERYLREACGDDADLCLAVQELVRADARADSLGFLDSGPSTLGGMSRGALVGQTLGSYEILEWIADGGMGSVYKARHTRLKTLVALKVLCPTAFHDSSIIQRFQQELEAVGGLRHPNIVRALDAGEINGIHYLSMELVEGQDLSTRLGRGPLPAHREACDWVRQAALGLQHAFETSIVHRDIKPSNLMLTPQGVVKVLDLGLARFFRESTNGDRLTRHGQIIGTLDYIAPEQIDHPDRVDIRSDIYSLGCTLYQLLTGHVPFPGSTTLGQLEAHRRGQPKPIRTLRRDVPPALERLVEKMIAKNPSDRPATPVEVAQALEPFCSAQPRAAQARLPQPRPSEVVHTSPARGAKGPAAREEEARPAVKPYRYKSPRRLKTAVALFAVMLVVLAAAGTMLRIKTRYGMLTIECLDGLSAQAEVLVDGDRVVLKHVDDRHGQVSIAVGDHQVKVRDGDKTYESDGKVTINREGKSLLRIHLVPKAVVPKDPTEVEPGTGNVAKPEKAPPRSPDKVKTAQTPVPEQPPSELPAEEALTPEPKNLTPGRPIMNLTGHKSDVFAVAISPDNQWALSSSTQDDKLRYWNLREGRQVEEWAHPGSVRCSLAFYPAPAGGKGSRLAVSAGGNGGHDRTARRWDLATHKELGNPVGFSQGISCLAVSGSGQLTAACDMHGLLQVWTSKTGADVHEFKLGRAATALGFSVTGKLLVSASDDEVVRIWDVKNEKQANYLDGNAGSPVFVGFDRYDQHVISATGWPTNTVRQWRLTDKNLVRSFKTPDHLGAMTAAALSADGLRLLTGHHGGYVALWDLETSEPLMSEKKHQRPVATVAISRDGKLGLSGGGDQLWLWQLPDAIAPQEDATK